jgi:ABC-type transport system involved in multi-copper enzyme maturation permease subunit
VSAVSTATSFDLTEVRASRQRLVAAELLKVTSTKMWLGFLVGVVLYIGIGAVAVIFTPAQPGVDVPTLETEAGIRNLFAQAGGAYVFAIVLGALGMTQEIRHQTLTSTFLAEPRRNRVMVAKMAAYGIVGAVYGAVGVVFGYALAFALLPLKDHADIPWTALWQIAGGAVLGCALFAILGVAVGTLIRNQIAAILLILVWVLLIEALVVAFLPSWGKWLPGGAIAGVLQSTGFGGAEYLDVWQGSLVLIAYAAVFGAIAALTTQRRDVT